MTVIHQVMRPGGASDCTNFNTPTRFSARIRGIPASTFDLPASTRRSRPPSHNMADTRDFLESLAFSLSYQVPRLNSRNYSTWKRDMQLRLQSTRLWDCVTTDPPDPPVVERTQSDARCLMELMSCCEPAQREILADCRSPKEAWTLLRTTFEARTPANINRLWRVFDTCTKRTSEDVTQFHLRVKNAVRDLLAIEETVSTPKIVQRLFMGLGPEYEILKSHLNMQSGLTERACLDAMLAEESRLASEPDGGRPPMPDGGHPPVPESNRASEPANTPRQRRRSRSHSRHARHRSSSRNRGRQRSSSRDRGRDKRSRLRSTSRSRDRRRSPPRGRRSRSARRDTRSRNGLSCSHCGRPNHDVRNCWDLYPHLHPSARITGPPAPASAPVEISQSTAYVHPQRAPFVQGAHVSYAHFQPRIHYLGSGTGSTSTVPAVPAPVMPAPAAPPLNPDFPYPVALYQSSHDNHSAMTHEHSIGQHIEGIGKVPALDGQWLIDSGATNHFTSRRNILTNFREVPDIAIDTGNGRIFGKGFGDVKVNLPAPFGTLVIQQVMWVPDLAGYSNLLSVPQLTDHGYALFFDGPWAHLLHGSGPVAMGLKRNRAYYLDMIEQPGYPLHAPVLSSLSQPLSPVTTNPPTKITIRQLVDDLLDVSNGSTGQHFGLHCPDSLGCPIGTHVEDHGVHSAMLSGTTDTQPLEVWHRRLGHLNQDDIHKLTTLATGMVIGPSRPATVSMRCDPCLKAAQTRQVSRIVRSPQTQVLGCVHIDLKGPCLEKGIYGFRYFMPCTDEKTRFTRTYPLIQKSDAATAFMAYHVQAERETNCKLIAVQFDVGGEFLGTIRTYCQNHGIYMRFTAPYAPEMNGLSERVNRTIIEHATAMLWTAQLPVGFWTAAVQMATFLKNRSPTKALATTPYEAYYGHKPNLGFIRVFGCRAKVAVPDALRTKSTWDAKSTDCLLIGYFETENLYELWDIQKGSIIRARDVVFWEDELGADLLRPWALPNGTSFLPVASEYVSHHPLPSVGSTNPSTSSDAPLGTAPVAPLAPLTDMPSLTQPRTVPALTPQAPDPPGRVFIDMNQETAQAVNNPKITRRLPLPTLAPASATSAPASALPL